MKKSINNANEREIKNSRQNIVIIDEAIKNTTDMMKEWSDTLSKRYEDGDRRAETVAEALMCLYQASLTLKKLRSYEEETIALCTE